MPTQFVPFDAGAYLTALAGFLLEGRRRFLLRGLTPTAVSFAALAQPLKASFAFTLHGTDRTRIDGWPPDLVKGVPCERVAPGGLDTGGYDAIFVFVVDSLDQVLRDYDGIAGTLPLVAPRVPYAGPAVPIVALPKSGGTWLTDTLAQGLGTTVSYSSRNTFPTRTIEALTLEGAVRAGHVLHEHADASPLNVQALQVFAPRVVLHLRDPRGALLSLFHYLRHQLDTGARLPTGLLHFYPAPPRAVVTGTVGAFIDWALSETLEVWVTWIAQWLAIADGGGPLRVLITDHADIASRPEEVVRRVLAFVDIPQARLQRTAVPMTMEANFRRGDPHEWQAVFSATQRSHAARLIPTEMKRRFDWADA